MASEGLVCSQVRYSECPQGCMPFGFGLRELLTSSCLRLVSAELYDSMKGNIGLLTGHNSYCGLMIATCVHISYCKKIRFFRRWMLC